MGEPNKVKVNTTRPATPLPWRTQTAVHGYDERCRIEQVEPHQHPQFLQDSPVHSRIAIAAEPTSGAGEQNAAYIVHAANSYPRLVEALREALKRLELETDGDAWTLVQQHRSLLRELGEEQP